MVSALLKKISVMVEDVEFTRGASFCLNLHPKTQVKCYHLLGAMPGMGIFALWSTEQNWVEVMQEQDEISALESKTTQTDHKIQSILLMYCGVKKTHSLLE